METVDELITGQLQRLGDAEVPDTSLLDADAAWEVVRLRAASGQRNGHRGLLVAAAIFVVVIGAATVFASYERGERVETPTQQPAPPPVPPSGTVPMANPQAGPTAESRLVPTELQGLPFDGVAPGALVWTGESLVWWRGDESSAGHTDETWRYDRSTNSWSQLPRDPLAVDVVSDPRGGAAIGDEAVFWAPEGVVALNPAAARWRAAAPPPHGHSGPGVLAAEEIVFPLDGLAYKPATDTWRQIAAAPDGMWPQRIGAPQALWTGSRVVVAANLIGIYDTATDTWRTADTYDPTTGTGSSNPRPYVDRYAWAVIEGKVTLLIKFRANMPVLDTETGRWADGPAAPSTVSCEGPGNLVSTAGGTVAQDGCGPPSWRPDGGHWVQVGIEGGNAFGTSAGTFSFGTGPSHTGLTLWTVPPSTSGLGNVTPDTAPPPTVLKARIALPSTSLAAGASMEAQVVVQNNTGQPVRTLSCQSPFTVTLANDQAQQTAGEKMCGQTFEFPMGESSWPVRIAANYGSCTGSPGPSDGSIQRCLPAGGSPPLPVGRYTVTAQGRGIDIRATNEIDVT